MVLAFVKLMIDHGHNPAHRLWVQWMDIDRVRAMMCYIQLALWNIPAQVVVGNVLSLEVSQVLHTPAHYLGCWDRHLLYRQAKELMTQVPETSPEADKPEPPTKEPKQAPKGDNLQFDFSF